MKRIATTLFVALLVTQVLAELVCTRTALWPGFDGKYCKMTPSVATDGKGLAYMTYGMLLLTGSDVFYGSYISQSTDGGTTWSTPRAVTEFPDTHEHGLRISRSCNPRYNRKHDLWFGLGLAMSYKNDSVPFSSVVDGRPFGWPLCAKFDPKTGMFSETVKIDFPLPYARAYPFGQMVELDDGDMLVPFNWNPLDKSPNKNDGYSVFGRIVIARCHVDRNGFKILEVGKPIACDGLRRGVGEPSLIRLGKKFYLTLRSDEYGMWCASEDGLNFSAPKRWTWTDDGKEIGNRNTQQHWMKIGNTLYLAYTRVTPTNGHVFRNRAPIFLAEFDPLRGGLVRETERPIVPERGARLGNFCCTEDGHGGSWLVTAEWMQPKGCEKYGSDNSIWLVKVSERPAAQAAECPTWISVMRFAPGHEAEVAADAARLGNESFINGMAWCASIHPTGNPVYDIAADLAGQYRKIDATFRGMSKVKNGILLQSTVGHGVAPAVATPWQICVEPGGKSRGYKMCPLDERFLAYIAGSCRTLSKLNLDFFMVDDDTRMIWDNSAPGCFCPLHLAAFGRRTGRSWTREEVVAMLKKGSSRERDIWCEVKAESLRRLFRAIRDNIRSEVPGILCVCCNAEHMRHAREYAEILAAPGQTPVIRGGGAPYHNGGDSDLYHLPAMLEHYAAQRAALGDGDLVYMQEADTCPQTQWACSATREMNHLVMLALNDLKGAKIWITRPYQSDETRDNAAYRRVFREHRALMRYAAETKLELDGLVSPVVYARGSFASRYLAHIGVPYRVGTPRSGDVTVLNRDVVAGLGRERLMKLLAGKVILDGPAARWLTENGYAAEIGVRAKPWNRKTIQRHRLEDGVVAQGIRSQYLTDLSACDGGATVLTHLDNVPAGSAGEYVAPGSLYCRNPRGGEVISLAYAVDGPTVSWQAGYLFTERYKRQLVAFARRLQGHIPGGVYYANNGRVLCQAGRTSEGDRIVAVLPMGLDDDPNPEFRLDSVPSVLERLDDAQGTWTVVPFEDLGDNGTIRLKSHLHTQHPALFRIRTRVRPAERMTVPRVFRQDGAELPYRWHAPQKAETGRTYPLVVFFHGAGERGDDNLAQLVHGADEILSYAKKTGEELFFIAGQVPKGRQWVDTPWSQTSHTMPAQPSVSMKLALALVERTMRDFPVDPRRVYVTGISMGGYGTWDAVQRRPDLFAAAIPICGGGDVACAERIRNVPIWCFHGDRDATVPTCRSRAMYEAIRSVKGRVRYREYPGVGHNCWTATYRDETVLAWLFAQ